MPEKRQHKRHKKRITVKFGEKALNYSGYTLDVSQGGMFLVTSQMLPLRARLHIQLNIDTTNFLFFEGEVRRQKVVPTMLRSVERGGFGVRFLHPGEVVKEIVRGEADPNRYELTYPTREALMEAYERELSHGGVFISTSRVSGPGTKVVLDVSFGFSAEQLEVDATIVHVAAGGWATPQGVGVLFDDKGVVGAFQAFLSAPPEP